MKDNNRNAIRSILKPSPYPLLLLTEFACYCANCTRDNIHELISDLRQGYANNYTIFNTANTDQPMTCEVCNERITGLDDLTEDPHEAEMREAAESQFDRDW